MPMPLRTKKITSGANDLANAPTDTSKNLNAHPTLNDGSQSAHPSLKFKISLDNSALASWSVEGWMFRFRFPQDCPCRRRRRASLRTCPHAQAERARVQVQHCMFNFHTTQALHPRKTPWITHRGYAQYDIDLPSESGGRRVFIVINFRRAKPLVHRPWTFPHQAEIMDDAFGSG